MIAKKEICSAADTCDYKECGHKTPHTRIKCCDSGYCYKVNATVECNIVFSRATL